MSSVIKPLLGWIDFHLRTREQRDAHDRALAKMPKFAIRNYVSVTPPVGTKILLTNLWKHPYVVQQLGFPFPGWHQYTGSCVGVGGGNVEATLAFGDVIARGQQEKIIIPWWPLNYGRSRYLCGDRGQGEGSMGSTFAQSAREDGICASTEAGLTPIFNYDMLTLGKDGSASSKLEYKWSDGGSLPNDLLAVAKKHIGTTAELHSANEVRDAIVNGYPVTRAFGSFCDIDGAVVKGDPPALIGNYRGNGGHQECWLGWWNHPQFGELFWEQNTWGLKAYAADPAGGPLGGCWQLGADVDRKCKTGDSEIYAWSQWDGYEAQEPTYVLI